MLRILVCAAKKESAQMIHKSAYAVLQKARIKCELAFSSSAELMRERHMSPRAYDIYVFDAQSSECLALAEYIRAENLVSSIMFLNAQPGGELNRIIKYRPSYVAFAFDMGAALAEGIKHCCTEQISLNTFFTVKTKEAYMRFDYKDIMFFESVKRIVCLYTVSKAVEFYAKLGDIVESLPAGRFVKCHQSYIVNLEYVRQLDKTTRYFQLISGAEVPISKSCYAAAVEVYEKYSAGIR